MTCADSPDYNQVVVNPGGTPISGGGTGGGVTPWAGFNDRLGNAYLAWTYDPRYTGAGWAPVSGYLGGGLFYAAAGLTTAHVTFWVPTTTAGATANQNFVCLYQATATAGFVSSLSLVGQTAAGALDGPLVSPANSFTTLAWTAPVTLSAGTAYYVMFVINITGSGVALAAQSPTVGGSASFNASGNFAPWPLALQQGSGVYTAPPATVSTGFHVIGYLVWAALS